MSDQLTFIDALIKDRATIEEFEDYIEAWHKSPDADPPISLHDYLGLTWDEYRIVALNESALDFVLEARRRQVSLAEILASPTESMLANKDLLVEVQDLWARAQAIDLAHPEYASHQA